MWARRSIPRFIARKVGRFKKGGGKSNKTHQAGKFDGLSELSTRPTQILISRKATNRQTDAMNSSDIDTRGATRVNAPMAALLSI